MDDTYINDLYLTMMARNPDSEGKQYWLTELSQGTPRRHVLKQFCESQEFTNICAEYGINRGTIEQ